MSSFDVRTPGAIAAGAYIGAPHIDAKHRIMAEVPLEDFGDFASFVNAHGSADDAALASAFSALKGGDGAAAAASASDSYWHRCEANKAFEVSRREPFACAAADAADDDAYWERCDANDADGYGRDGLRDAARAAAAPPPPRRSARARPRRRRRLRPRERRRPSPGVRRAAPDGAYCMCACRFGRRETPPPPPPPPARGQGRRALAANKPRPYYFGSIDRPARRRAPARRHARLARRRDDLDVRGSSPGRTCRGGTTVLEARHVARHGSSTRRVADYAYESAPEGREERA